MLAMGRLWSTAGGKIHGWPRVIRRVVVCESTLHWLIPLKEYENKDIYENDKLKLPFNNTTYIFNELDN